MNQPIEEELSDWKEGYALLFKESGELRRERDALQEEVNRLKMYSGPAWWPAVGAILNEYGLQAFDFVADFKKAQDMAVRKAEKDDKFCDANCCWTDHNPDCFRHDPPAQPAQPAPDDTDLMACWIEKPDGTIDGIASMRLALSKYGTAVQPAVPLTDEQINDCYGEAGVQFGHMPHEDVVRIARSIESAHGIKGENK